MLDIYCSIPVQSQREKILSRNVVAKVRFNIAKVLMARWSIRNRCYHYLTRPDFHF